MTQLSVVLFAGGILLAGAPVIAADIPPSANIDNMLARTFAEPWFDAPSRALPSAATLMALPDAHELPALPGTHSCTSPVSNTQAALEPLAEISRGPHVGTSPKVEVMEAAAPPQYKDVWERVRAGFQLPRIKNSLVEKHQALYLNRLQSVERILQRSHRYLFFIMEELQKRDMPTEVALLPIIESAYDPKAYSSMRAAGIWQFIPSTGRHYGLEQDLWYDGRRDVPAATRAALDYLQILHRMFGDWQLALAAYNWGEGNVRRAIAHNRENRKSTNYASLNMPNETRNYLPKLQAVKNIIKDAKLFGLELKSVPNRPYFAVVNTRGHIDVTRAARFADMEVEEFRSLNLGYKGPVIIHASARQIVLPIDKVGGFNAKLESTGDALASWEPYTLKRGETLRTVASRASTTVFLLRKVNGFDQRRHILPGQILLVPVQDRALASGLDEDRNARDRRTSDSLSQTTLRLMR